MKQRGFIMLGLIGFLPVLVTLLISISALGLYLKTRSSTHYKCRKELLSIQKEMVQSLNQLQALNPKATGLRAQEKILKASLAVAVVSNPPAVPGLRAQLAANQAQQSSLHLKQLAIIGSATVKSKHSLTNLRSDLHAQNIYSDIPRLAVEPIPPSAIAPDYVPVRQFEFRQAISVEWQNDKNKYLKPLFENERNLPTLKGQCSATISKNARNQWTEKLGMASL